MGNDEQFQLLKTSLAQKLDAILMRPDNVMQYLLFLQEYNQQWAQIRSECNFGELDRNAQHVIEDVRKTMIEIQREIIEEASLTAAENLEVCLHMERKMCVMLR
jgi:hypothetical protein